jgi:hypothetical protein
MPIFHLYIFYGKVDIKDLEQFFNQIVIFLVAGC